ncbi:hypothetical protein FB567DRAFT_553668 [Paraphoma chrysanthemicola]|uniref:Uncharacterized protein n=1 Tax=Paraphoma chrysanthemicola TaxID=798071 RepID=A0A8K0VTJ1_9PLEO|nr:hypothetical protein FB567DRAFT_553668 [Paraphoma chrysanthemicola]
MTPEHPRKSGRLRDIFKRSSASPQVTTTPNKSPEERQSSSQASPTSPLSPTIKPGFEQVGLLPSQRSSLLDATKDLETHGGGHLAEVLARQEEELRTVGVPQILGTDLDVNAAPHADETVKNGHKNKRAAEQAFTDALHKHQDDHAESEPSVTEGHNSPIQEPDFALFSLFATNPADKQSARFQPQVEAVNDSDSDEVKEFTFPKTLAKPCFDFSAASGTGGGMFNPACRGGPKTHPFGKGLRRNKQSVGEARNQPISDIFSYGIGGDSDNYSDDEEEEPANRRSSLASNIFDNRDPLSQDIREYVCSKIAEALVAHEGKNAGKRNNVDAAGGIANEPFRFSMHIDVTGNKSHTGNAEIESSEVAPETTFGEHRIGCFEIGHAVLAVSTRAFVALLYSFILVVAGIRGFTFLMAAIADILYVVAIYVVVMRQLGYLQEARDFHADVIAAPVYSCAMQMGEVGKIALQRALRAVVLVIVEALQDSADGD